MHIDEEPLGGIGDAAPGSSEIIPMGSRQFALHVRLAEWVPPVGGALGRHTSTWQVQATGYTGKATGEAGWCPEASSRGDAKQPRGAADRARIPRGVKVPPSEFASYADRLGYGF
jgi:hypothetical protein